MIFKKGATKVDYKDVLTLSKIYPLSYEFARDYIIMGNEYVSCLVALAYPSEISELTITRLMNLDDVKVSLDITRLDKSKVLTSLSQSIEEYNSRTVQRGLKITQKDDAAHEEDKLRFLSQNLSKGREEVLATTLKFWLRAGSKEELYLKLDNFRRKLKIDYGINSFLPSNDMDMQFTSLLAPDNSASVPMPLGETLSEQMPFHGSSLIDKYGWYFGNTSTGDLVVLDPFTVTNYRTSFNMLLIGKMGAGKSTTIKSMIQDALAYGHTVLTLDIEGEQKEMAEYLGGKVLSFGDGVTINPLEMRSMSVLKEPVENDEFGSSNNKADFTQQLSRIVNFFVQYCGKEEINTTNKAIITKGLREVFKNKNIDENTNLDMLSSGEFPLIEDLVNYFENKAFDIDEKTKTRSLKKLVDEYEPAVYRDIATILKPLVDSYGNIFNKYTSFNLRDNSYIVFDISKIQGLEKNVSNALMFNILSIMWQEVFRNREINKGLENDPVNRRYVICVLDEAHRFFSNDQAETISFISKMVRQARKNSAALWFASQSVNDFYPEGNSELAGILKSMFELVPYKILLQMDSSAKGKLTKLFSEFQEDEIIQTFNFAKGQMMLYVAGEGKFIVSRKVHDEYLEYFGGGR